MKVLRDELRNETHYPPDYEPPRPCPECGAGLRVEWLEGKWTKPFCPECVYHE
jgi:hypothetical protein